MSRKKQVFSTTDFYGNLVFLTEETWYTHVVFEHPGMAGYELAVQQIVENPEEIRVSTAYPYGAGYISLPGVGPGVEGIRAIVSFESANYEKGASTGKVVTAYPIDVIKYASPQLGRTIFKK